MELRHPDNLKEDQIMKGECRVYVSDQEAWIITNAGLTVDDLEQFSEISDLHACAADGVIIAARLITRIEDDLRAKIEQAYRDLECADAALTAGEAINGRGVLEYTATEIDMLAARRADAYTGLAAACRTAAALLAPART
ncbi:hypothetical protein [Actinoallomurus iriomotensis]|uniref:Uncharacterized protein n=1 Tax=Actinoallomurus iriomotensis TaxID=478107 RepID=A0A9W6RPE2_9ACTN|nr:hypothetical protein [Actinoallomurus iriomotensis]GLY79184.1 hypothetical protein Airi01_074510 [Actinoallomurus iriomotensis]